MPGRLRVPRPGRPRRADIAAAGVIVLFVASVCVVGAGLFIQLKLKPTDGRFGVPQYLVFPFCGRDYTLGTVGYESLAQIDAEIAPGYAPFVLEPTIGQIPPAGLLTSCPISPGGFYATVIWLHVGGDKYVGYALEGGP